MNSIRWLSLAIVLALTLGGCAANPATQASPPPATSAFPYTFTDDGGRSVTVKKAPARIVSLSPGNTELLYALGLGAKVVGVDDFSDFPEEAKTKEKVGGFAHTNLEKVVSLAPDLVVASDIHYKTVVPELEKHGLTTVVLAPENLEAVLSSLRTLGRITGQDAEANRVVGDLQKRLDAVAEKVKKASAKPRVFFELDATLFTVGPGSFVDDMIVRAGGQNIAADAQTKWPQLNAETIVTKDPEVIVLTDHGFGETPDKVKGRPGWASISAVKANRIVEANPDLVNRPGPRAVDGLESLAKALHPELF